MRRQGGPRDCGPGGRAQRRRAGRRRPRRAASPPFRRPAAGARAGGAKDSRRFVCSVAALLPGCGAQFSADPGSVARRLRLRSAWHDSRPEGICFLYKEVPRRGMAAGAETEAAAAAPHPLIDALDEGRARAAFEGVLGLKLDRMRREGGKGAAASSLADIEYAAEAYELAAIDMWRYAGGGSATAAGEPGAAQRAGDLESLCRASFAMLEACPVPGEPIQKICHVLLMFSYAYVGERGEAMGRYLDERGGEVSLPDEGAEGSGRGWEYDVLAGTYAALLCVIRKRDAAELRRARDAIARLREMQGPREAAHMESFAPEHRQGPARRLAALYHLARCVDLLAEFMETGRPDGVEQMLDFHFDEALALGGDVGSPELDVLLRAVRPAFVRMAGNSVWALARRAGDAGDEGVAGFVGRLAESDRPAFELTYPQRAALEGGLLDPYGGPMLVSLPASGGKTLLAELRIVQAVGRGGGGGGAAGIVAYVVPTAALADRIAPRLRRDLGPAGITVEKASGAAGIDGFEEGMLARGRGSLDVLVATPEKLLFLIRSPDHGLSESISLCIIDEAHSLGDGEGGLSLELLISTVKRDCRRAGLLLFSPFMPNGGEIAEWLDPHNPRPVTAGGEWMPNERVVGAYYASGRGRTIDTHFRPLATGAGAVRAGKAFKIGTTRGFSRTASGVVGKNPALASLLATQLGASHGVLVLARTIRDAWGTAGLACENLDGAPGRGDKEVELAKRFVASELGERFPLVEYLDKGVGVHHAGLPDDVRRLMERLMEMGRLRALVGTADTARGASFPASAVLVSPCSRPRRSMDPRDFWSLAGRAGRIGQPSFGLVGIATDRPGGPQMKRAEACAKRAAGRLASPLVGMVSEALARRSKLDLAQLAAEPRWSGLAQYIAHMRSQAANPAELAVQAEVALRQTLGYGQLDKAGREALRDAVRRYAASLDQGPDAPIASDLAGFSPQAAGSADAAVRAMGMRPGEWSPQRLFSPASKRLSGLIRVMAASMPEVGDIAAGMPGRRAGGGGGDVAGVVSDWVSGAGIPRIAQRHFGGAGRDNITDCVRAVCGRMIERAARGLGGLQRIYGRGREEAAGPEGGARNVSAMVYYGVGTDAAVLMRMNSVPRGAAAGIGAAYAEGPGGGGRGLYAGGGREVREWLSGLGEDEWGRAGSAGGMSGRDLREVWSRLSGHAAAPPAERGAFP